MALGSVSFSNLTCTASSESLPDAMPSLQGSAIVQLLLKVQLATQTSLKEKNVVCINRTDFAQLFGDSPVELEQTPKYIQIGSRVFRIAIGTLSSGWIMMTSTQTESLSSEFFKTQSTDSIVAIPFVRERAAIYPLKKIRVRIADAMDNLPEGERAVLSALELKERIRAAFLDQYVNKGQACTLGFLWGEMIVTLERFEYGSPVRETSEAFGCIDNNTEIELQDCCSGNVTVVGDIYSDEVLRWEFGLTAKKRTSDTKSVGLPLALSEEYVTTNIKTRLIGRTVCEDHVFKIDHPSGWDILVQVRKPAVCNAFQFTDRMHIDRENLVRGYILKETSKIDLKPNDSDIIITGNHPVIAERIKFKIADMPGDQAHQSIDTNKERWVCLDELKKALRSRSKPFTQREQFDVELLSGTYTIIVESVKGMRALSCESPQAVCEQLWAIDDGTIIEFEAEPMLEVNLVKNMDVLPLKAANIQLTPKHIPDKGLIVTTDELRKYLKEQGPKRLVNNRAFTIRTHFGHILDVKILSVKFNEALSPEKKITAFGFITGETEIDFTSTAANKISLVDEVYSDTLESMQYTLIAYKLMGAAKFARLPLVVKEEEITTKIREELAQFPFVLEGHTIEIPHGEGWKIEAKFKKGIVVRGDTKAQSQLRFTHVQYRKGFACRVTTKIQFDSLSRDFVLVAGHPKPARKLNLKVVEVLENSKQDDLTVIKGNWINVEELHQNLQTLNSCFCNRERFVVQLSSGKFLLEVTQGKGESTETLPISAKNKTAWRVINSTKINLAIEKKFDTQAISTGKLYPLKKIEFIATPVGGEHTFLKDKKLKKALMETLPDKVIEEQVLAIETSGSIGVHLEVKEMKTGDDLVDRDTSKIFGVITPETDIAFLGKSGSKIAIQTTPKFLQVEDPIKYFRELGLAGIDDQVNKLYNAFLPMSPNLRKEVELRGTKPVKGILLYGPPGTGKSSIAQRIGAMLGCSGEQLIIINAPEVLNMWLGESENNVRDLFKPALQAQEKYGTKSPTYMIIIDEVEAILGKRGNDFGKTRDSILNQFLGIMDGIKKSNNVIVIGLTNRRQDIDPAMLRHGRLGVQIQVPLPDAAGRKKIFEIHTDHLKDIDRLAPDINFETLARETDGMPGADIEGLIKEAEMLSYRRIVKLPEDEIPASPLRLVTMKDLLEVIGERKKQSLDCVSEAFRTMFI